MPPQRGHGGTTKLVPASHSSTSPSGRRTGISTSPSGRRTNARPCNSVIQWILVLSWLHEQAHQSILTLNPEVLLSSFKGKKIKKLNLLERSTAALQSCTSRIIFGTFWQHHRVKSGPLNMAAQTLRQLSALSPCHHAPQPRRGGNAAARFLHPAPRAPCSRRLRLPLGSAPPAAPGRAADLSDFRTACKPPCINSPLSSGIISKK